MKREFSFSGGEGSTFFSPKKGRLIICADGINVFDVEMDKDKKLIKKFKRATEDLPAFDFEYISHSGLSGEGWIDLDDTYEEIYSMKIAGKLIDRIISVKEDKDGELRLMNRWNSEIGDWIVSYERGDEIVPLALIHKDFLKTAKENFELISAAYKKDNLETLEYYENKGWYEGKIPFLRGEGNVADTKLDRYTVDVFKFKKVNLVAVKIYPLGYRVNACACRRSSRHEISISFPLKEFEEKYGNDLKEGLKEIVKEYVQKPLREPFKNASMLQVGPFRVLYNPDFIEEDMAEVAFAEFQPDILIYPSRNKDRTILYFNPQAETEELWYFNPDNLPKLGMKYGFVGDIVELYKPPEEIDWAKVFYTLFPNLNFNIDNGSGFSPSP
jgi:hypothetical protein